MIRLTLFIALLLTAGPSRGLDDEHHRRATAAIDRGIGFLRGAQNEDGSWSPQPGPAITAMVVEAMLSRPRIGAADGQVEAAVEYILARRRPDGGIHDGILANYNTAICLSALSLVDGSPQVADAIAAGRDFLRRLQWHGQADPAGEATGPDHRWHGGAGYGRHGRPDLSNTQIMLQGLRDSGVACDDPAFQRAMVFISRCQGVAENDLLADRIRPDGGFIYATSTDKDLMSTPQSQAGAESIDDPDGDEPVSILRTYGSMTYAGFKSYVYAQLERDDPRVTAACRWIRENYTLDGNPGMPADRRGEGLFYMYMTMGKALSAWGATEIETADGARHDWANELVDRLVTLQRADGSWVNEADRWMEGDPVLVTAYALSALESAIR